MSNTNFVVQEKTIDQTTIASIRMKGWYGDCGKAFGRIYRSFGRLASGPPMLLHHDCEYKENDADFEACIPVKQPRQVAGIDVRPLPGGHCVALLHQGPYNQLHTSYAKITQYIHEKGYRVSMPTREVYLKGPGMIFKGNPKKYLTEIQFVIEV